MKDFWEDLWGNFIRPYFIMLIIIGILCWIFVYTYLIYIGAFKWFDILGIIFISSEVLIAIFYKKSKLARNLEPLVFSDKFWVVIFCAVTFSNLMHIDAAWPIFCFLLKTKGVTVALAFLGFGIYNYFTIPKD